VFTVNKVAASFLSMDTKRSTIEVSSCFRPSESTVAPLKFQTLFPKFRA
jgi:hypothetical protein